MTIDSITADNIKHISNTEVVRRLLIKYFSDKGFNESFDRHLYPSLIQDLPLVIPALSNKVEIKSHAEDIDPSLGKAVIGWNIFVLGNHRMYLGDTYHNDLSGLARQIKSGFILPENTYTARRQSTPKQVITFITRVLGMHDAGYVDLAPGKNPTAPGDSYKVKNSMAGMPQQFFAKPHSF